LFKFAQKEKDLKEFIQNNPDIIHLIKFSLNQARSASIHASAVIIVPKKDSQGNDVNIFNWLPIRKMHDRLVSEWEGKYTDRAGFLKEDILGLNQLDKFDMMCKLIKKNHDKDIILEEIELNDRNTYKLFHKGYTEDIFQFGSSGLKSYSSKTKPDTIEDLTAMSALYRPGPMSSNAHTDFAMIKHGKKKPEYDPFMKPITENTNGLIVYQEQVMQAVVIGGLSLVEADMVRTTIKKFDKVALDKFKEQFIEGYVKLLMNK
jgi:DNA polymerase-3 subunit alpha